MKRGLFFVLLLALLLTTPVPQVQAQSVQEISAEILDMTEQMQFPADQESVEMRCPVCLQTVTWYALHVDAEINTQETRRLNNLHIYMVGDIVGEDIFDPKTNTGGFMFRTAKTNRHSVIHLNGHTLNASQGVLMVEYGEVSIIGDGEAWGRRNNPDFGSALDVRIGAELNIYGGKYYRNSPQPMVKIVEEGTFNLYGGTLEGNDSQEPGSVRVENGTFNLYGGVLESGFSSRVGSNLVVYEEGTANIYGGEFTGGRDASGGNIYNKGTLNIYGGKISGEIREEGGNETITGGYLDSKITAENASITGGTFTTDITPFVKEGFKANMKNGTYTVGEGVELPWMWIAVGGAAVVVLVVVILVVSAAGKKKKAEEKPQEQ